MREIVFRGENKDLVNAGLVCGWQVPMLLDPREVQQESKLRYEMAVPLR